MRKMGQFQVRIFKNCGKEIFTASFGFKDFFAVNGANRRNKNSITGSTKENNPLKSILRMSTITMAMLVLIPQQ